ncbi:MAG: hypothetical protein ACRDRT_11505 [Pseudonocardiaceae bacterium]
MVKLEDPTLPFADVVARHRREQAAADAATFGLWASTHDWRAVYPEPTAVAGIGASEQALAEPYIDLAQRLTGASGGLLVDLGFQICPIGAITSGMLPPSLLVWVAGETTTPEERRQLAALGAPGLWIGPRADAIEGWSQLDADVFADRADFIRRFVGAVASLVEVPEAAYVSNNLSNELRRTGTDDGGRTPAETPADLHRHGRRRTRADPPGPRTSGS